VLSTITYSNAKWQLPISAPHLFVLTMKMHIISSIIIDDDYE